MLDDFTPIIHKLDGRTIKVWAIADVHIGAKECDLDGFKAFLKRIENDPDSYVCLVGDICNNGLKSANCPTDIYAETMNPSSQIELAAELLEPIKDRILGAVGGNHERRTTKAVNVDIMNYIMCLLRVPEIYRPNMAFIRVNLERGNTKDHYALMITHGKNQTRKKNFTSIVEGIDAAIFAHTHTPDIVFPSRIRLTQNNNVVMHNVIVMTCCSFLKPGGYSLSELYVPQVISRPQCLILEFTGSNAKQGQISVAW